MTPNYPACLAFTLSEEGGWSDNPKDPGGKTMKGITIGTFRRYVPNATPEQLRAISDAMLSRIYHDGYWVTVHGDELPIGVDLMLFDFGVTAGPGRSVRIMQQLLKVADDGIIGPATLKALRAVQPLHMTTALWKYQLDYYKSLATWPTFGGGWKNRSERRLAAANVMVAPGITTAA